LKSLPPPAQVFGQRTDGKSENIVCLSEGSLVGEIEFNSILPLVHDNLAATRLSSHDNCQSNLNLVRLAVR
jgi:hypothetical protein